jgi:hypothetical protein
MTHPKISLGLIIVEGHRKIVQEAQHRLLHLARSDPSLFRAGFCLARPGLRLPCSDFFGAGGGGLA